MPTPTIQPNEISLIGAMPEICEAALMMGTVANREILATAGLLVAAGQSAKGGDLIIAVRGATKESAERAVDAAETQLNQPRAPCTSCNQLSKQLQTQRTVAHHLVSWNKRFCYSTITAMLFVGVIGF